MFSASVAVRDERGMFYSWKQPSRSHTIQDCLCYSKRYTVDSIFIDMNQKTTLEDMDSPLQWDQETPLLHGNSSLLLDPENVSVSCPDMLSMWQNCTCSTSEHNLNPPLKIHNAQTYLYRSVCIALKFRHMIQDRNSIQYIFWLKTDNW